MVPTDGTQTDRGHLSQQVNMCIAASWADTWHKAPELGRCALKDTQFGEILHIAGNNRLTATLLTRDLSEAL